MNPTRKTFLLHTIRSTSAGLKAADVLQDPMSVLCMGSEPLDHSCELPNHSPPGNNRIVPLHNVKQPAHKPLLLGRRNPPQTLSLRMRTSRRQRRRDRFFLHQSQVIAAGQWWSQTGSNRRHRACKARALPAELWPPLGKDHLRSSASKPSAFRQIVQKPGVWWAWEDLNFRPHAYQARALTN